MLSEHDIINWQKAKRQEWMRDKQAILDGKMRPEALSSFLDSGKQLGQIDFSKLEAALERDDDSTWAED